MPNISEMNQELVRAFNTNLCRHNIAITNLTVQNLYGKDHIVISFDKDMDSKQCVKYLSNMKEKIIKRSYGNEKVAGVSYNLKFFPFAFNAKHSPRDDKGRKKFSVEIDEGVVFNLKCYLAKALVGDVKERMGREFGVERIKKSIYDTNFDRNSYLYCMLFHDKELQIYFIDSFISKIGSYENAPRGYLEVIGNSVYIKKSIFDNVEFIKDIEAHDASLICRDFEISIKEDRRLESLKFPIIDFIHRMGIPVYYLFHTSYKGSDENSVLIPIVAKSGKGNRLLDDNDTYKINSVFNMEILSDVSESISVRLPKSDSSDGTVYGIDFADVDIAYCVLNKIIESSVINAKHELSIDPELRFRALSPSFPTPPPTPVPNRHLNSDEKPGLSSQASIPTHLQNGGLPGPLSDPRPTKVRSPTKGSHSEELGRSPRQGFMGVSDGLLSSRQVDVPGTSKGFWPPTQLSSSGPSSWKVAAQNVSAAFSHELWSSQSTSGNKWPSSPEPEPSESAWTSQPIGYWPSSAPSAGSRKGAAQNVQVGPSVWPSPAPSAGPSSSEDANESRQIGKSTWYDMSSPDVEDVNDVEPEEQQVSDGCSEAKSQESESPKKKHGGGVQKTKKWKQLFSSPFKKQDDVSLKRNGVGRDTTRSTPETPVTEKPPVSKRSFSFPRIKSKSNPPSGVASPTHEGVPEWQQPLDPDQREKLREVLSPEMRKKLDANFFPPGYEKLLHLLYVDSKGLRSLLSSPEAKEQVCSVLPPEEIVRLLHKCFSNQKISDNASTSFEDSGYSSGLSASPAVPHKGSVPSKVKECSAQHMLEALRK